MTRAVLVGYSTADWRLYRQPQWMAEVRRSLEATQLTRQFFDIEDSAYREAADRWNEAGSSLDSALELLRELGAIEVVRS